MQAWENFLKLQEKEIGVETVAKWLRSLKVLRFDACNLYLEAKDSFQAVWFEEHVRHRIQTDFYNNNNKRIKVHLSINNASAEELKNHKKTKSSNHCLKDFSLFNISFEELDPYCSLDNFITSDNNLLAHKLLLEVSQNPKSPTLNPIFFHGPRGVGKSHLLMATAHKLKKQGLKVMYSQAETFAEHVVKAIRAGEMQTFRKAYRNVDALLIDDVHTLSRKNATQEEFFHTFNTLHLEGKQIVLASNYAPLGLKFIEPRLVSRFEWGIVLPLGSLTKDQLSKVLLNKASSLHFPLHNDILNFLLTTFTSNTGSLVKALEALALRSHLDTSAHHNQQNLSIQLAQEYLSDLIEEEKCSIITPERILHSVAEFYGIHVNDILSKSHAREYTLPRQISMYFCRSHLNMPYMKIGDFFSRDHSTVMTSVKQIQQHLNQNNKEISSNIGSILSKLQHI